MSDPILIVSNLSRSFTPRGAEPIQAVDDVSLSVTTGQIYGLVGPDGAGKTTTLRLIFGAFKPDSGTIKIGGFSVAQQPEAARTMLGYLSQRFSLYEEMTVMENIRFMAEVRGMSKEEWLPRARQDLAFVGLDAFKDRLARQLSGGMKQKLSLACALISRPRLLLLDEPTTGVDPITRQDFWQLIIRLAGEQGLAVLICTPYMDEASRCSRVSFMRNGKIIQEGTPRQLRDLLRGRVLELSGTPLNLLAQVARADPDVQDVQRFGDRLHLKVASEQSNAVRNRLPEQISAAGGRVDQLEQIMPMLEDVFIDLTGSSAKTETEDGRGER